MKVRLDELKQRDGLVACCFFWLNQYYALAITLYFDILITYSKPWHGLVANAGKVSTKLIRERDLDLAYALGACHALLLHL